MREMFSMHRLHSLASQCMCDRILESIVFVIVLDHDILKRNLAENSLSLSCSEVGTKFGVDQK